MSISEAELLFTQTLKSHGSSVTAPRKAVFQALDKQQPMSMHELVLRLHDNIDRASVYRIVDLFERLHIVERISIGWKYKLELSDKFSHHHHHIICEKCGRIDELHGDSVFEKTLQHVASKIGFDLHAHQIELRGFCASCQKGR